MTGRAEMTREQNFIVESDVFEMLREPVSQAMSHLKEGKRRWLRKCARWMVVSLEFPSNKATHKAFV